MTGSECPRSPFTGVGQPHGGKDDPGGVGTAVGQLGSSGRPPWATPPPDKAPQRRTPRGGKLRVSTAPRLLHPWVRLPPPPPKPPQHGCHPAAPSNPPWPTPIPLHTLPGPLVPSPSHPCTRTRVCPHPLLLIGLLYPPTPGLPYPLRGSFAPLKAPLAPRPRLPSAPLRLLSPPQGPFTPLKGPLTPLKAPLGPP